MSHDPSDYPYEGIRGPGHSGYSSHSAGPGMQAIDFRTPIGTPIYAPARLARWRVSRSENRGGESYGQWVELAASGVVLRYAHLSDRNVRQGTVIPGGKKLGETGDTGNSSGPHLHFEANKDAWKWAKWIWSGKALEPAKEWDEMASKAEIKEVVREVVREEGETLAEWAVTAAIKAILGRDLISGYGGDIKDTYEKAIKDALAKAKVREAQQHS